MTHTRLQTDVKGEDVLLNIWWQETSSFSLLLLVSDQFVFYGLLQLLPRSKFEGEETCKKVRAWFSDQLGIKPEIDEPEHLVYSTLGMLHDKGQVRYGRIEVRISFEESETDVDISFFTAGALERELTLIVSIPDTWLGQPASRDLLTLDVCTDPDRPVVF